jgi:hypothetical protein
MNYLDGFSSSYFPVKYLNSACRLVTCGKNSADKTLTDENSSTVFIWSIG